MNSQERTAGRSSLEQLSDEQRATLELLLAHDQTYDDVSSTLGMPAARVRERAHSALEALAPPEVRRLDAESRASVSDYLLGAQSGVEAKATRKLLRRSEPARAWALSALESVGPLYEEGGEPYVPGHRLGRRDDAGAARGASQDSGNDSRRWKVGATAAAVVAVLALAALGVALAVDEDSTAAGQEAGTDNGPRVLARLDLRPLGDIDGAASALLLENEGRRLMFVKGQLPPVRGGDVYRFWLLNTPEDAVPIDAQATDKTGHFEANGPLPEDWENYRYLNVSRESSGSDTAHSGESVLEAPLWRRRLAHFFGRL